MTESALSELVDFIREHRGNEANFSALWKKAQEQKIAVKNFEDVAAKAEAYRQAKGTGGTAWPEFEKFVTELERGLTKA